MGQMTQLLNWIEKLMIVSKAYHIFLLKCSKIWYETNIKKKKVTFTTVKLFFSVRKDHGSDYRGYNKTKSEAAQYI